MAAFQDHYRGFQLTVSEDGAGYTGEVRPTTPEAEAAIHGFHLTRGNLHGSTLEEAMRRFIDLSKAMIDKVLPPA